MSEESPTYHRIPRPGWLVLTAILLVVVAVALPLCLTYYQEQRARSMVKALGGRLETEPICPEWLRDLFGNDVPIFKRIVGVNLVGAEGVTNANLQLLGGLSHLGFLGLRRSDVNDEALTALEYLPPLEALVLADTAVGGDDGMKQVIKLNRLTHLDLQGSRITDRGLRDLASLPRLKDVSLGYSRITDDGIKHLQRFPSLRSVNLQYTRITDRGVEHLSQIGTLIAINLQGARISDNGLRHLAQLLNLQYLDLSGTSVTPSAIDELQRLLPKCKIRRPY